MSIRVGLIGGHLTPALAVIEELKKRQAAIVFFGRPRTMEGDVTPSIEYELVTNMGILFIPITSGRLLRVVSIRSLLSLARVPLAFIAALFGLLRTRPDVVVSFGGYLAVPIVLAAALLRIPIVSHEQTMILGAANRFTRPFAKKTLVSFPESIERNEVLTGNPVRKIIFSTSIENPLVREIVSEPYLLITGGNQGAHAINKAVAKVLPQLLDSWRVVHQTGDSQVYQDLRRHQRLREELPERLARRYFVMRYLYQEDMGTILQKADIVVCRAGANTVWELALLRKRAVLIPLSISGGGEQEKQAEWYMKLGLGVKISDNPLGQELLSAIKKAELLNSTASDIPGYITADGARRVVKEIFSVT